MSDFDAFAAVLHEQGVTPPLDPESPTDAIVVGIYRDITDRRGLRQEWDGFDDDVVCEIIAKWRGIVSRGGR